jgi:SAM-dependent methyltransferase
MNGKSTAGLYIQYGCGLSAPDGWVNFDASSRLWLERRALIRAVMQKTTGTIFPPNVREGDIVVGLPIPDASAAAVYSSHCLEHISRGDVPKALSNTLRMLRRGGVFRLIVPDLEWRAKQYLAALENSTMPADEFLESCHIRRRMRPKTLPDRVIEGYRKSEHLWMYDFATFKSLLEKAGFSGVRRCQYGDASDPMFALVEDQDRFVDKGHNELAIEAIKPS